MFRRGATGAVLTLCGTVLLSGCMPKMTIEQMKAEMPRRPAELDELDAFVGTWEFDGEATFAMLEDEQPLKTTGRAVYQWEANRSYLVGHSEIRIADFDPIRGLETWTYDTRTGRFRGTWTDSMGTIALGECSYDEEDGRWEMKATSYGPWGRSTLKGWYKLSDDTMEWCLVEYTRLCKTMKMRGTAKRVK